MGLPRVKELLKAEMELYKKERKPVRALATKIGVSPASLYNYAENDIAPREEALRKLAIYFRVSLAELLGEESVKGIDKLSSAGEIFEGTIAGRSADEQLVLMSRWLEVVREYDRNKDPGKR